MKQKADTNKNRTTCGRIRQNNKDNSTQLHIMANTITDPAYTNMSFETKKALLIDNTLKCWVLHKQKNHAGAVQHKHSVVII